MNGAKLWGLSLLLAGLLAACSSGSGGGPGPDTDTVTISGTVWQQAAGGDAAAGAQITASADVDGDGNISDSERAQATAATDGSFQLAAPARADGVTVVTFSDEGYAPLLRTLRVQETGTGIRLDAVLQEAESLQCEGLLCRDDSGAASVSGIEVAEGYVRVFNPVAEAAAFPGAFRDDAGNMLVSSVFASFDLRDGDGRPIHQLPAGQTARVTMRVPRDTWPTLQDLLPGDDRVQVPLYFFDEVAGQWRAEGSGWLGKADGSLLGEDELDSVRAGSFAGDIVAVADVAHFSYWNVDWPQEDATTIIIIIDPPPGQSEPPRGAVCHLVGVNFAGTSPPVAVGADGSLCFDVQRSEPAGEDLDGNGTPGETRKVLLSCTWKDKLYRFGPFDIGDQASGTCPASGTDLGRVALDDEHAVSAEVCTLSGRVLVDGQPLAGVSVSLSDEMITPEEADALCGGSCQYAAMSEADGSFTVTTAWAAQLLLEGNFVETRSQATVMWGGRRTFMACPQEPVEFHLHVDYCLSQLPQVSFQSGNIDWQPPVAATSVSVQSQMGGVRWLLYSEEGVTPPLGYGQVPAGAQQVLPQSGSPVDPQSGDMITVVPLGGFMDVDGLRCNSVGTYQIP